MRQEASAALSANSTAAPPVSRKFQLMNAQKGITFILFILSWELLTRLFRVPDFILPPPSAIANRLVRDLGSGTLIHHGLITVSEIFAGLAIGVLTGVVLGALLTQFPKVEAIVLPYIIAFQTLPKVAIAPLFIIWFGYGWTSKVVIAALIALFPVLINVMAGLRSVTADQMSLMISMGATPWQIFAKVRVPSALPMFFAGLEIAVVLSIIGAIVGEFLGAQAGWGYLIQLWNFRFEVAGVFAVLILLSATGLALHALVRWARRRLVFWTGERSDDITYGA